MNEIVKEKKIQATYLFPNDMVFTYDLEDEQIPQLQGKYSKELHQKLIEQASPNTRWYGFPPLNFSENGGL